MAEMPLDDVIEDLRGYIERDVAAAFLPPSEIVESAVEVLAGDCDPAVLRSAAERLVETALESHRIAQATWPAVTDCDRLDSAFAALEKRGIVARQDFSCCGTCGAAEIIDEMDSVADTGATVRGYTFYHTQDTESAVEGRGLFLNYGATEDDEAAALTIGREIVEVLRSHELSVVWDGSWEKRIHVPLSWQRRRAAEG